MLIIPYPLSKEKDIPLCCEKKRAPDRSAPVRSLSKTLSFDSLFATELLPQPVAVLLRHGNDPYPRVRRHTAQEFAVRLL